MTAFQRSVFLLKYKDFSISAYLLYFPLDSLECAAFSLGGLQKRQFNINLHLKSSSTYLSIGKLKMKRSALIAALLALSLSACGEKPAETAVPVAAPATEIVAPVAASATEAAAPATETAAPATEAPQSATK
ncbi:MAG: hypothetical protein WC053_01075 [Sideroxydans sp.]